MTKSQSELLPETWYCSKCHQNECSSLCSETREPELEDVCLREGVVRVADIEERTTPGPVELAIDFTIDTPHGLYFWQPTVIFSSMTLEMLVKELDEQVTLGISPTSLSFLVKATDETAFKPHRFILKSHDAGQFENFMGRLHSAMETATTEWSRKIKKLKFEMIIALK